MMEKKMEFLGLRVCNGNNINEQKKAGSNSDKHQRFACLDLIKITSRASSSAACSEDHRRISPKHTCKHAKSLLPRLPLQRLQARSSSFM